MGGLYYLDRNLDRKYGISDPRSIISSNYGLDKWIGENIQWLSWAPSPKEQRPNSTRSGPTCTAPGCCAAQPRAARHIVGSQNIARTQRDLCASKRPHRRLTDRQLAQCLSLPGLSHAGLSRPCHLKVPCRTETPAERL